MWHLLHYGYLILYQAFSYEFKVEGFCHMLGRDISTSMDPNNKAYGLYSPFSNLS